MNLALEWHLTPFKAFITFRAGDTEASRDCFIKMESVTAPVKGMKNLHLII